jgi:undecaprenyl-diphosphatase
VQGITEFLPISSDGHLAITEPLIWTSTQPRPNAMDLTIVLHLGTLASILVYYRRGIWLLLGEDRRALWLIAIGTIPAVVLVLIAKVLLDDYLEPILKSTLLAGFMLPVTGLALLLGQRASGGQRHYRDLSIVESLLIGCAQACAILPGRSRSGSTISAALPLGLSRRSAATFSFLLAIPALAGAGVYEAFSMLKDREPLSTSPTNLAIGAAVSCIVGLGAIAILTRVLERGRLHYFAWYCMGLGVVVIALHFR